MNFDKLFYLQYVDYYLCIKNDLYDRSDFSKDELYHQEILHSNIDLYHHLKRRTLSKANRKIKFFVYRQEHVHQTQARFAGIYLKLARNFLLDQVRFVTKHVMVYVKDLLIEQME